MALEIYRSVCNSIHFELIGGSSTYDHGRFVYENHIDNIPFITDKSELCKIEELNSIIVKNKIDYIYPAMDGVLYNLAKHREFLDCVVIAPSFETAKITRSKALTYEKLNYKIDVPVIYNEEEARKNLPIFIKPDVGQGSVGAYKINTEEELYYHLSKKNEKLMLLEYLPGNEYTIDCYTNKNGELIYASGRGRKRVKSGISVNAIKVENPSFLEIAKKINNVLNQVGGWFFQLKENKDGKLVLLEVASRIAGGSSYVRNLGVNLPLLTMFEYDGQLIDSVMINNYELEMDRALYNSYKLNIDYDHVYVDYDDTIIVNDKINIQLIAFLYDCVNRNKKILLITKHKGNIREELKKIRLEGLFDNVIVVKENEEKIMSIKEERAIFIDDSYGERYSAFSKKGILTFDTHMIECLFKI